ARDVLLMAVATASSRLLGLFRDVAIADQFGVGAAYDAFLIAFFVPHFLRQLLAEGALSTAMVPVYTELRESQGNSDSARDADAFASNLISWLILLFPLVVVAGILFAPWYVPFLASGFDSEKLALTVRLTRIVFPFIAVIGISAVMMGILNAQRRFFAASFAPVWYNVGMLLGILALAPRMDPPILGVGLGVLIGGSAQLLSQVPALLQAGFRFRFRILPMHPQIRRMLWLMAPAFLTLGVTQVNLLVDNKLASHLGDGGISALQYAMRLFQLPLGVLAVSVATALLPRFSQAWARRDEVGFLRYLNEGIVASALVLLPAMVGLLVIGRDVVRLLFEHGSFASADTVRTARALSFYLVGLVPYGWVYVLTRAAYARRKPLYPLLASIVAVGVNVALDLILISTMREAGLALATAVAGICNAAMLGMILLWRQRLDRQTVSRLGWIGMGCVGLFAITALTRHWMGPASPVWAVSAPTVVGVLFYAAFVRLTPLWKAVSALREPSSR
ncbi:murein biosynthesis integral membrane protein MurJ, partial [Candidatus Bipolaricaulota bacterium]|nr:murein biosynthesis integral membrane protein MurJ [Candidatus Bipolaricaulota bacterium]